MVLVSRSEFPDRQHRQAWLDQHCADDVTSERIRTIEEAETAGGQVLVLRADVTSYAEMQRAIEVTAQEFGTLHGVIHAAGISDPALIQLRSAAKGEAILSAKAKGALVLHELLQNYNLDFVLYCSSLSSILGGHGQADYAAANAFLDAFAQWCWDRNVHAVSVNWDTWNQVGMAMRAMRSGGGLPAEQQILSRGMTCDEGVQVLLRALRVGLPQIVVATTDFATAIEYHTAQTKSPDDTLPNSTVPALAVDLRLPAATSGTGNQVEEAVAQVWEQLLGVKEVKPCDNFFELGGDSLLGTRLLDKLRATFGLELPLGSLLEVPTVAGMAERIKSISSTLRLPGLCDKDLRRRD
ncbi:MAG: SDR family oxidoreductase [Acidobacteriales bacterium]|nr:SDR family oxidoreductase [Terriglobales bacterium]